MARVGRFAWFFLVVLVACQPDLVERKGSERQESDGGTSPSTDASVTRFVALGDFGTGGEEQRAVAEAMCDHHEQEPFDYAVTTGDNIYASGEIEDFEEDFFVPYDCLFEAGVDFHAVLGNHDDDTLRGEGQIAEERFGMPARDYTWELGPISFVMFDSQEVEREIDPEDEAEYEEGSSYDWVLEEIEKAQGSGWTVVVFHQPVFSTGDLHGSEPGFEEAFAQEFSDAGVDLVLNGHDHNYQWGEHLGVTYVVTGGGGAELYDCVVPFVDPIENCLEENHFVEVEVSADEMTLTAIDSGGEVIDEIEVAANP